MAPIPPDEPLDPEEVIYEAAESGKIPPKPNIFMLKAFLEPRGVNFDLYTKEEWLQKYEQARAHLQEIKDAAEQVKRLQDKPRQNAGQKVQEWPKEIDSSSEKCGAEEIDSGYGSANQVCYALRGTRSRYDALTSPRRIIDLRVCLF
jgi:hypothetical protein